MKSNAGSGAAIGGVVLGISGVDGGLILRAMIADSKDGGVFLPVVGGAGGALIGAGFGALIGSGSRSDRWETLDSR
jgi:hypothetical protein